jgi:hypothetical protein
MLVRHLKSDSTFAFSTEATMSHHLDPLVSRKLQQFQGRRRRLIIARGLSAGLLAFILGMAAVALIDWYWLLADSTRWYMSIAVYVGVVVAVWLTGLRRLIHLPAREEIAEQMELTEPELRENLLSAVELSADDPSAIHDSPVFRNLVQGKVAELMTQVRVPNLLPFRLVASWVVAALVVVGLVGWLLNSGDQRIQQLAIRAVLPGANIARVSRIHVKVLEPTPHSLILAEDETVAVVVDVTGGNFDDVTLETSTPTQGTVRHIMRGMTGSEFAANILVGEESVEYRILAGDAITQRFRIESRARPHVLAFHKTYRFPEYAQLEDETVTEPHGDLLVLEGTESKLILELDQEVSSAELRIAPSDSDEVQVVTLERVTDQKKSAGAVQWMAQVPVSAAGIYKVHLVSKETEFENIFSPKYEIRPLPDLIPKAGFVNQQEPTLLLPPNDILALQGMAEDDLPVVSLEQQISVNGREWQSVSLDAQPSDESGGRRVAAAWDWDLLGYKLKTGDQVLTKLVATDRKGNIGESIPLRVVVAAPDFDPERHTVMEFKAQLYDELKSFADLMDEQKTLALAAIERIQQPDRTEEKDSDDRTIILELANTQRERATILVEQIKQVERAMPAGADAYDLDLTGRVIARIQREHSHMAAFLLKAMQHIDEKGRKEDLVRLGRVFNRVADDAGTTAKHYQLLMSHNFLAGIAADLDALLQQQRQVVDSPTQTWTRLLRQESLVINQLQLLNRVIGRQRDRLPLSLRDQMRILVTWTDSQRLRLQDATESEEKLAELRRLSQDFLRQLQTKQKIDVVEGSLPGRIVSVRRDFLNRSGGLYVPINEVGQATRQENRLAALATASADSEEGRQLLDKAERFVAEVDLQHRWSIDQLRSRRELTQSRRDADAQYAADAGLTHRAVTSLLHQHRKTPPQESTIPDHLLEVAPAYRTLEAGHDLIIARDALNVLLNLERWGSQNFTSHIEQPRQWDVVQHALEVASQRLQQAGVERSHYENLNQVRSSEPAREAGRKISERRSRRDAMIGAGHELVELRDKLAVVVKDVQPVMAEARAIIARYAPTIPEMARQAAEDLRELEQETTDTADVAEQTEVPETTQQLAELQQQQAAINAQIEDLFSALVEDANSQDVLDEDQRERARDADDSVEMIQEPAEKMNRALEQASQNEVGAEQAQDLAQAAELQEQTAQALELVAEHFGRLDEGMDIADSRAELRQTENELGIAREMEQRFEGAKQIGEMANQDGEQLMSELEAELQRNPAMQQALSEIAQNTLQEARNALEYAAKDDENVQRANEKSDASFQLKKRELAEDLRKMGAEAARLSRELVAQANQAAAQGKTPEAQKKLAESQQKLNAAAQQANTAREEQLLSDLTQTAQEAQSALNEAAETLKQAQQQTAAGKDTEIHADEKARAGQQKALELRRKKFQDQQKKTVAQLAKQASDAKRRADQTAKNAENQLNAAKRRVDQSQKQLNQKPEDGGRKAALAKEQQRQAAEQQKVALAKRAQERAEQNVQRAKQQVDEVNRRDMTPLKKSNPATQLADQYAAEAMKSVEQLQEQAQALADATKFENELTPPQTQLAAANERQGQVTVDVQQAADDVARAARHERRLKNMAAAEPLQQAAQNIQQVARNESTAAEQQLETAITEAQRATDAEQSNAESSPPPAGTPPRGTPPNAEAIKAQTALATAENAITQQANELTGVLEPLLAANEESGIPQTGDAGDPAGAPPAGAAQGQPPTASGDAGSPSPPSGQGASPANENPPPSFTAEELARGQQLAQTLDELDRQANADGKQPAQPQTVQPERTPSGLDSLAQAAQAQQSAAAVARAQAQQQASQALAQGTQSEGDPALTGPMDDFEVAAVNRSEKANWGKLRSKSAQDLTNGRTEAVSNEYRKSVEAYFRVLAERAKKK